jgi:hypothetical protein
VIWNNAEPISNPVTPIRTRDIHVPVFFGKTFDLGCMIFSHQPKSNSIFRLVAIGRESF